MTACARSREPRRRSSLAAHHCGQGARPSRTMTAATRASPSSPEGRRLAGSRAATAAVITTDRLTSV